MDINMELNTIEKLKRFCYLSSFECVYRCLPDALDYDKYIPQLQQMLQSVDDNTMLSFLQNMLVEHTPLRKDETLFLYALYLGTKFDEKVETTWRKNVRKVFCHTIRSDTDLFLFCKYHQNIRKWNNQKGFSRTVTKAIAEWYAFRDPLTLRSMFQMRRGAHGFTHKGLIRYAHINDENLGGPNTSRICFKTCTELLKLSHDESIIPANQVDLETQMICNLRTNQRKHVIKQLLARNKLGYNYLPDAHRKSGSIWNKVLPQMTPRQLLVSWKKMSMINLFHYNSTLAKCEEILSSAEKLKDDNIHPVQFLISIHKAGYRAHFEKFTQTKQRNLALILLRKTYEDSFGKTEPTGLRFHITVNLQKNYRKKILRRNQSLTYFEGVMALAFSYYKTEKVCEVYHWTPTKTELQRMPWKPEMSYERAAYAANNIQDTDNCQRLANSVIQAKREKKEFDVFLAIVPTAGRSNPHNKSDFLRHKLDEYRLECNKKAKYIIVNLRKFHKSMTYSNTIKENILEICGLDEHTPKLIRDFAVNRFE